MNRSRMLSNPDLVPNDFGSATAAEVWFCSAHEKAHLRNRSRHLHICS